MSEPSSFMSPDEMIEVGLAGIASCHEALVRLFAPGAEDALRATELLLDPAETLRDSRAAVLNDLIKTAQRMHDVLPGGGTGDNEELED